MTKPKKIDAIEIPKYWDTGHQIIWNKCCDDWEAFLPDKEEIYNIVYAHMFAMLDNPENVWVYSATKCCNELAEAIAKRIGK